MERYALVIDGKTVQAADHFEVLNPSTGAVAGLAPKASREQLDDAIEAAAKAQKAWAKRPDAERKQLCHAVADKIKDNAEELARLLTIEHGKPLNGLGSRF